MCCEEQDLDEIREQHYKAERKEGLVEIDVEFYEDEDAYRDYECPDCGGILGQSCICGDDLDYYNGMYAYDDWYETLSPLKRRLEDINRRMQNLRWNITWRVKEWWRENVRREELPF